MNKRGLIFGIGIGCIFSSFLILIAYGFESPENNQPEIVNEQKTEDVQTEQIGINEVKPIQTEVIIKEIDNGEVIRRARELGMVFVPKSSDGKDFGSVDYTSDAEKISVTIENGSDAAAVARVLREGGVIADSYTFGEFIIEKNALGNLKSGEFKFEKNMAFDEILELITE